MLEAIFIVQQPDSDGLWGGRRVLDLFAGTGALGIEALSRGAAWADFVEANAANCRLIRENLALTGLEARGQVHCCTVRQALTGDRRRELHPPYRAILLDPLYGDPILEETMLVLGEETLAEPGSVVAAEHGRRVTLSDRYGRLSLIKMRRHGDTCVSLYRDEGGNC